MFISSTSFQQYKTKILQMDIIEWTASELRRLDNQKDAPMAVVQQTMNY